MTSRRPTLVVIAGPNGSGKTTLSKELRTRAWFGDFVYINPDAIAQEQFGDWNSPRARSRAALHATNLISTSLRSHANIAIETVLTESGVRLMRRAKNAGYLVRFYFVGTSDPAINVSRVARRVAGGGHDIPLPVIHRRHHEAMAALPAAIVIAHHGHVYDNSIDDVAMRRLYRTRDGTVAARFTGIIPAWAQTAADP